MNIDILRKKLLYRSANRGWKENDILLGNFTKLHIEHMTEGQLSMLEDLLDEPDVEIFGWINNTITIPEKHKNILMTQLQAFKLKD
jgi:antitoxin CptB